MSRSRRRFPVTWYVGGDSLKIWKQSYNRTLRRLAHARLADWADPDLMFPGLDEVANPWDGPHDGTKHYTPWLDDDSWATRYAHYRAALGK